MKKIMRNKIILIVILCIISCSIGVYAATIYKASDVVYNASDGTSMNVEDALNELYNKSFNNETLNDDLIVASWLNYDFTKNNFLTLMKPSVYDSSFFSLQNGYLTVKKSGSYKIYYQSASDSENSTATINVLINGVVQASCSGVSARCANEKKSITIDLNKNDTIEVDAKSSSSMGARVVVLIVKLNENENLYLNNYNRNLMVASWLNYRYAINNSTMHPSVYSKNYFLYDDGKLIAKQSGSYKIYYQSASDSENSSATINVLINGVVQASCSGLSARCANEEKSITIDLNKNDTIEIEAKSSSSVMGARVVVLIVKLAN